MLRLKDFLSNACTKNNLSYIRGGKAGDDTAGGFSAFGKTNKSTCDIDNGDGTYDHNYGDEGWVRFTQPGG